MPAKAGGEVSSWLAAASLVPCAYLGPLFACAVAQAGSMQTSGSGAPNTHSAQTPWWAAGGRLGVLLPLHGNLLLRLRGDLLADLSRPTLYLDGGPVWPAPLVAASLGADALLRFP
jgi:hypothetical protein